MNTARNHLSKFTDMGLWLIFFGIIYIILLIKVATGSYLNDNLFLASTAS